MYMFGIMSMNINNHFVLLRLCRVRVSSDGAVRSLLLHVWFSGSSVLGVVAPPPFLLLLVFIFHVFLFQLSP